MSRFSEDDFEAWRASPITEAVLAWVRDHAEEAKAAWIERSWGQGQIDPVILAELKAREAVALEFASVALRDITDEQ